MTIQRSERSRSLQSSAWNTCPRRMATVETQIEHLAHREEWTHVWKNDVWKEHREMSCGVGCASAGRVGRAGREWNPNAGGDGGAEVSGEVECLCCSGSRCHSQDGSVGRSRVTVLGGRHVRWFYTWQHSFFHNCFLAWGGSSCPGWGPGRGGWNRPVLRLGDGGWGGAAPSACAIIGRVPHTRPWGVSARKRVFCSIGGLFFLAFALLLPTVPPSHSKEPQCCPGWGAQLVGASPRCAKVVGSIPGQGTYENQAVNAEISGTTNLSLSLARSLKIPINKSKVSFSALVSLLVLSPVKNAHLHAPHSHSFSGVSSAWDNKTQDLSWFHFSPLPMVKFYTICISLMTLYCLY